MYFQEANEYRFTDLYVGQKEIIKNTQEGGMLTITKEMQKTFELLSGNIQPIHTETPLVYGMLTASFYSTFVGVFLPGKYALCHIMKIDFCKPVYIGDQLVIVGEILEISAAVKQITIKAKILNQNNEKVSKAIIEVGLTE